MLTSTMQALLQLDMADASLAHRASYECDHDKLSNEPPAPVPFMGLQQSLEPQVRCGCDRSTMYLWSSPDACREAVTAWAETAPSVFGPSLQMLDPEIRKHTCWCTPRVGVVMLSGQEAIARGAPPGTRGVVVPALFHAVGCNTKTGRA
jgi:hypothetical protein